MFFLEVKGRGDVIGSVDPSQAERVTRLVDQEVRVRLEVRRRVTKSGSQGRPRYNLVAVEPVDADKLPLSDT
jgi:hypothetical protein